ncbi:MAG: hypothetical protein AB7K67_02310 [Hyphomicrobiaceae bacterium]
MIRPRNPFVVRPLEPEERLVRRPAAGPSAGKPEQPPAPQRRVVKGSRRIGNVQLRVLDKSVPRGIRPC